MSVIQMTTDQLQQLIVAIKASSVAASTTVESKPKASFTFCSSGFGGDRDYDTVEEFITQVQTYKDVEGISDEDALKGISFLFYGFVPTWWQGVRREANTWEQAIELIRSHYSPRKPFYQLYMEICKEKQAEGTAIDTFICQKRALLAQLPDGRHDEETEINLIYGLLHLKYRKNILRDEIKSFKDLLEKGRVLELTVDEDKEDSSGRGKSSSSKKKRCTYCNFRGHTFDNCRKRNQESDD